MFLDEIDEGERELSIRMTPLNEGIDMLDECLQSPILRSPVECVWVALGLENFLKKFLISGLWFQVFFSNWIAHSDCSEWSAMWTLHPE